MSELSLGESLDTRGTHKLHLGLKSPEPSSAWAIINDCLLKDEMSQTQMITSQNLWELLQRNEKKQFQETCHYLPHGLDICLWAVNRNLYFPHRVWRPRVVCTLGIEKKKKDELEKCTSILTPKICLRFPFRTNILRGMCDHGFTSASQKRPGGSSFHWSQRLGHHRSPCLQKPLWLIPRIPFYIKPSATRRETDTLGEERSSVPSPVFERASFEREFKDPKDHQPFSEQAPSFYEWAAHLIWRSEAGTSHLEEWGWHTF